MRLPINGWIARPIFQHDEIKTRRSFLLNVIVTVTLAYLALAEIGDFLAGQTPPFLIIGNLVVIALCLVVRHWLYRGRLEQASTVLLALLMIYLTVAIWMSGGVQVPAVALYVSLVVLAGLLLEPRGLIITTVLSALAILGLLVVESASLLPRPEFTVTITTWISYAVQLATVASLMFYDTESTRRALRRADDELAQRKSAERTLQASETRFRTLIEDAPVAIAISRDGVNLYANHAFTKMFGFESVDEIVGQPIADHWAPEWRGLIEERNRQRTRGVPVPSQYEAVGQRKDGSQFPAQITVTRVDLPDGYATMAFLTDLTECNRAEEELRESREKFQALVENTSDFIWEVDTKGRYTYCSPQIKELWGYPPQEMLGKTPFDQMKLAERDQTIKTFSALAENPRPVRGLQVGSVDSSDRDIYLEISFVPIWDNQQRLRGYRGISRDITERKRAEEQLRESETRFRTLSENALAGIYIIREGRLEYVNPALAGMFGYEPRELIGSDPMIYVHPNDRSKIIENMERRLEGQVANTPAEYRGQCKNGESRDISVLGAQVTLNGRPAFIGNVVDITDRKRVEEALRQSEEKFRLLTEKSVVGIYIVQDGKMAYVNPSFARTFGYIPEEINGILSPKDLIHPDDIQAVMRRLVERQQGAVEKGNITYKAVRKDGSLIYIEVYGLLIEYRGRPAVMGTLIDVTERNRAEQALRASEEKYRTVVENAGIGIVVVVGDTVAYANPHALAVIGSTRDEVVGSSFANLVHPADRENVLALHARLLAGEAAPPVYRLRLNVSGQGESWVQVNTVLCQWDGHQGTLSFVTDITDQRRADQALRVSEARFRTLVEQASEGIALVDEQGIVIAWNKGMEQISGIPRAQAVASPVWDVQLQMTPVERRSALVGNVFKSAFSQAFRTGLLPQAGKRVEIQVQSTSGERKVVEQTTFTIKTEMGYRFGSIVLDITERKRAEAERGQLLEQVQAGREQLKALSRRLVQVQEEERRYIARELHDEIGQVLTALELMLDTSGRVPPEAVPARLQQAQALVGQLIDQVQELALDLRPTMLDDYGLLPALTWHLGRFKAQTGIQVAFEHSGLEQRLPPEVETAAYRIAQEALTNVARHAAVNRAALSLTVEGEELRVRIADEGRGFDVKTTVAAGTSTGLSGMRERASALGGHLTVEGDPGGGTQITAILPLKRSLTRRVEAR